MNSVIGFVVALVPLIVLHEMGHMFTAKRLGVWVREFGLGLPPRIIKLFQWQETEFTLNWLPLGGFARMEGEEDFTSTVEPPAQEEFTLLVEIQEPMLMDEETVEPPTTEKVPPTAAELQAAQEHSLYAKSPFKRILIYLGGPLMNLLTAWVLAILLFATGTPIIDEMLVRITQVAPHSPAAEVNLQADDVILAINGERGLDIEAVIAHIQAQRGQELSLTVGRGDAELTVSLTPRTAPPANEGSMGVMLQGEPTAYHIEPLPLGQALLRGSRTFFFITWKTLWMPVELVQGLIPAATARPVGIINISRIAYQSIEQSFTQGTLIPILNLLILVSVSLGIFNLLPIPALDGGRILFTVIELLRKEPLSPRLQERIHQIALSILLLLFAVITVLDLFHPVDLPALLP
ncbi:MAG TPA: site-2 protease family protein [Thermoflexia bacterium]|nr:site-2 protease family protein [Thermoflexia bacterium]